MSKIEKQKKNKCFKNFHSRHLRTRIETRTGKISAVQLCWPGHLSLTQSGNDFRMFLVLVTHFRWAIAAKLTAMYTMLTLNV